MGYIEDEREKKCMEFGIFSFGSGGLVHGCKDNCTFTRGAHKVFSSVGVFGISMQYGEVERLRDGLYTICPSEVESCFMHRKMIPLLEHYNKIICFCCSTHFCEISR